MLVLNAVKLLQLSFDHGAVDGTVKPS